MLVALSIVISIVSVAYFLLRLVSEVVTSKKQILDVEKFSFLITQSLMAGRPDRVLKLCADIDTQLAVFVKSFILARERPDGVFGDVSLANETTALRHASEQLRLLRLQMIILVPIMLVFVAAFMAILWKDGGQTGWVVAPITLATIADIVCIILSIVAHQAKAKFFKGMDSHLQKMRQAVDEGFSKRGEEPSIPPLSSILDPRARVTEWARRNSG